MHKFFSRKIHISVIILAIAASLGACGQAVRTTPTSTPTTPTSTPPPTPFATPLTEITLDIDLPEGDAKSGRALSLTFTCAGYHNPLYPSEGPPLQTEADLPGILERGDVRIAAPDYKGRASSNQEYSIESVYLPEAYIVPGEWKRPMPTYFLDRISHQELADIIAWIETLE